MEEPLDLEGKPGEPVPQVDAQDLRTAFEIFRAAAKNHPGQHVGVSVEVLQRDCKPGANIRAVSYRFMMLNGFVSTAPEQLAPWMKDGQLDDIVFREAAQIPINRASLCTSFPPLCLAPSASVFASLCDLCALTSVHSVLNPSSLLRHRHACLCSSH